MPIIVPVSILALLLSFLASFNKKSLGLEFCFIIVTFIQAVHFDVGNDYIVYYHDFLDLISNNYAFFELFEENVVRNNEYGWGVLYWVFGKIFGKNGFFFLVAVLSIIQNFIYYFFIKTHVERKWWFFSVFVYLFTPSFYLLSYSGLRQWLVIAFSILVFIWLEKHRFILAILLILLCVSIHTSSWVLFLYVIFLMVPYKKGAIFGLLFPILFLLFLFSPNIVESFFQILFKNEALEVYEIYMYDTSNKRSLGAGFILNSIPFFVSCICLISNQSWDRNVLFLLILSCLGSLVMPFVSVAPLVTRVSFYFNILSIASIPYVYKWIKIVPIRAFCLILYCFMTISSYVAFYSSNVYGNAYDAYQTFFSLL